MLPVQVDIRLILVAQLLSGHYQSSIYLSGLQKDSGVAALVFVGQKSFYDQPDVCITLSDIYLTILHQSLGGRAWERGYVETIYHTQMLKRCTNCLSNYTCVDT